MREEAQQHLERIEEILGQIERARSELFNQFGPELKMAIDLIKNFDKVENDMKQLRGEIMEYVV